MERCPTCSHPLLEHENGRCLGVMLDHGWNQDTICDCTTTATEEPDARAA
jgi:hypothetical protein